MLKNLIKDLENISERERAKILSRFFKTGKGEYGEGDIFVGITVPKARSIAKKYYKDINMEELQILVSSEIHEYRLTALLILIFKFTKSKETQKQYIDFYLSNTRYINNWDLVDLSCYKLLGVWLHDKDKSILFKLAESSNLWEQRISIVTCMHFIRNNEFDTFLSIAEKLLFHKHDLIHKAIGWLLREMGKKDISKLEDFLEKHCTEMPRTMLRYSIERFPKDIRQYYLKK